MNSIIFVFLGVLCVVQSTFKNYETSTFKNYETEEQSISAVSEQTDNIGHKIEKRFVDPSLAGGELPSNFLSKIRAKRSSEEECEKLRLCRLHAQSNMNFFAAFELYFVNKENARLWDHHTHSLSDCSRRYTCYR